MAAATVLSPTMLSTTSEAAGNVAISPAQEPNQTTQISASELLVAKISSVVQSLGYNDDSIDKVASRVSANIVSGKIDLDNTSTQEIGQLLDTDLLNREKLRSQSIYLNSNEPVLLLEIPEQSEKHISELAQVKSDFLSLLRLRSIAPVRVYVRKIEDLNPSQFGFCLLNVVNTDIGGPSMVQLLDAAFHGESWKNDLIIKEAFNGDSLIWRDEVVAGHPVYEKPVPVVINEPEVVESDNDEPNAKGEVVEPEQSDVTPTPKTSISYRDINDIPEEHEEDQNTSVEHPAMEELRRWESGRQHVEHPSWAREDDGDLLDIITTQSASIKEEDPFLTAKAESDEFELVEKA